MNEKILIIEDDLDIARAIRLYLKNAGYETTHASDGLEGRDLFLEDVYDMVIVDMMLPKMSGLQVIQAIREKSQVPILILSAKSEELDMIEGLSVGADDYIKKPFSPAELLARVQSALRRWSLMKTHIDHDICIGDLKLDLSALSVEKSGQVLDLTASEFKILKLLMTSPGQIFSKKQICQHINGDFFENDLKVVVVHISNIRDKIGQDHIKTIRGLGYKIEK